MEGLRDSPPDFNGGKSQITPGAAHVTGPNGSPLTTILTAGGGIGILVLSGVVNTEHDRCMTVSVRHSRAANGPVDCDPGCEQSNGTRAACCTPRNTSPRVFPDIDEILHFWLYSTENFFLWLLVACYR